MSCILEPNVTITCSYNKKSFEGLYWGMSVSCLWTAKLSKPCDCSILISKTRRMEIKIDSNLLTMSYIVLWRKRLPWFRWLTWFEIHCMKSLLFSARIPRRIHITLNCQFMFPILYSDLNISSYRFTLKWLCQKCKIYHTLEHFNATITESLRPYIGIMLHLIAPSSLRPHSSTGTAGSLPLPCK